MEGIRELILRILKDIAGEKRHHLVTASEVRERLKNEGIMRSTKWVGQILKLLAAEGEIIEKPIGRTIHYFIPPDQHTLDEYITVRGEEIITRDEIQDALEQVDEENYLKLFKLMPAKTISERVGKDLSISKHFPEQLKNKIDKISNDIAEENPRELFKDMFEDLIEMYRKYADEYKATNDRKREAELYKKLQHIYYIIDRVYGFILGIPMCHSKLRSPAPNEAAWIYLPSHKTKEYKAELYLNILEKYLERRTPDDKFIIFEDKSARSEKPLLGTDSSTMPIEIRVPVLTRRIIRFRLNTVVGYTKTDGGDSNPIIFPRPESLDRYDEEEAEEEGFIIRPETFSMFPDYYHDRIREAQMNQLEFRFVDKTLSPDPIDRDVYEKLKRPPPVVLLDGRIFPYEHKLSDYVALHGKYVQRSIRAFVNSVRFSDALKDVVRIIGVVKRGHLAYLWTVVSWYMMKRGLFDEDDFLHPGSLITEDTEMRDEYIAFLILKNFYDSSSEHIPRTFAIIRRFYSMDPDVRRAFGLADDLSRENSIDFWFGEAIISERVGKQGLSGYVEERGLDGDEAWPYAEACAKAAVAIFYHIPPLDERRALENNRVRIPRFEVLIPYSYLIELPRTENIKKVIRRTVVGINSDEVYLYDEAKEGIFLILPRHVKMAHTYVKEYQKVVALLYSRYLLSRALRAMKTYEEAFFKEAGEE